jgi:hypothetical protein
LCVMITFTHSGCERIRPVFCSYYSFVVFGWSGVRA